MFCRRCGNELKEGVHFCSACGASTGHDMTILEKRVREAEAAAAASEASTKDSGSGFVKSKRNGAKVKPNREWLAYLMRLFLLLSLICFLGPFASVSCGGDEDVYSGLEMAKGLEVTFEYDGEEAGKDQYDPNPYLIVAAALLMVSLFVGIAAKSGSVRILVSAVLALVGYIFLLLFKETAIDFYELKEVLPLIEYDFLWAYKLARTLSLLSVILGALHFLIGKILGERVSLKDRLLNVGRQL